ncbi:MAG: hypothetical protein HETSPECPRED_001478 [Heterodermia speciosa]|uniref:Major facilitator superfamily (MFS) profile domain-containing protein n=1 Tax=Heterodermia speciosa TaxID=116794 RepID=A0A8H3J1P8_9LECA|nr:MAG: hypothetical protein HETSPECPRED_001478 [Heterodermia speciosa]
MAGINTAGRPTLSQRRSRMSQLGEEELDNLAFRPNIVPSLSSGRNDSIASQTESEVELNKRSRVVPEPGPPPNGGLKAWQQVLGAFFLNFNTWGLVNTFGIFQDYYATGAVFPASQSAIAWLGSIQGFLMLTIGVLCGRAIDAGYLRINLTAGITTTVFGMMMVSISREYWQFILTQGVVAGLGSGATFIPSVTVVGTYFSTRRSLAIGVATTGSSIGGIVYPFVLRRLIAKIGFGWAVRVMAFIMLATLLISLSVMRSRLPPRKSGPIVDFSAFRDPAYSIFLASVLITYTGLYVPFFYVESYATSIGISGDVAFDMLIIMNAASVVGRLLPPFFADRTGNLAMLIPCTFFSAIIILAWIRVSSQEGLIAISVMYGFISGSIQAVVPATVAFLCPDLSKYGTRLGMTLAIGGGLGLLVGAPIAGAILDTQSSADHQEYWGLLVFSGTLVFLGALLQLTVRVLKVGWSLEKA